MNSGSPKKQDFSVWKNLGSDIPAGVVVFLVAVPLCLGIALASGAPLASGIIAGIVGGLIVPFISRSALGVSGPAAGLAVIVYGAIQELGFEPFLLAVVLAGILQMILGFLRAGIIGYYFPSSVITGMLSGIGIIIFLKQIPHAVGYDTNWEGNMAFQETGGSTTFSTLQSMTEALHPGAIIVAGISLAILILWEQPFMTRQPVFKLIQGPLVAVISGILLNFGFQHYAPELILSSQHLVQLPLTNGETGFAGFFAFPDFSAYTNPSVYTVAFTIAIVASLETLLCLEAADKLDPFKRISPTSRELVGQGLGNFVAGLIGGLPVTQVIVRSSTNIIAGARTKASAFVHGLCLVVAALVFPQVLNLIPLATLASILFMVGYKLAKPSLFVKMFKRGWPQFLPFMVTIVGLVFTDLLTGVGAGAVMALIFILLDHYNNDIYLHESRENGQLILRLAQHVTFLNKANLLRTLDGIPGGSEVIIDGLTTQYLDHDILECIENFQIEAEAKNINLVLKGLVPNEHGLKIQDKQTRRQFYEEAASPIREQSSMG